MDEDTYILIKQFGVSRLAEKIHCSPALVSRWQHRKITPERAIDVSKATGIPLTKLRPDIWREEHAA